LRYKNKAKQRRRNKERQSQNHIKANWETHQIKMKYRDNLSDAMAGPPPQGGDTFGYTGGLQSAGRPQNLSVGVSSQYFDVGIIKEARGLNAIRLLLFLPCIQHYGEPSIRRCKLKKQKL